MARNLAAPTFLVTADDRVDKVEMGLRVDPHLVRRAPNGCVPQQGVEPAAQMCDHAEKDRVLRKLPEEGVEVSVEVENALHIRSLRGAHHAVDNRAELCLALRRQAFLYPHDDELLEADPQR